MKSKALGTKVLMALVCAGVLAYFVLQAWEYFSDPLTTTMTYSYQVEKGAAVTGWIVRQEQVLTDTSSGLLRLSRSEGEKVSKGGRIAVIYADQASLDRENQISALEAQAEQLEYARESALNSEASLKLDNQIISAILDLRRDVTSDRLDAAGAHAANVRNLVMKRDYTYTGGGDLDTQLADLTAQLKQLRAQSASSTRAVTAPASGIYSAVVDGYESVLTPEKLAELKPSSLGQIQPSGETSELGKLITGDVWYYAVSMSAEDAAPLSAGKEVTLRFAKGTEQDLTVSVDSIGQEENGRVLVVFSSDQYLSELTMLRRQSADVITNTITGIRVPSRAIRTSKTVINSETKERTVKEETGVYCVVGVTAQYKPVRILYTDPDGYVLVQPKDGAAGKEMLRAGDEVILSARDLYDGKVVRSG